MVEWSVRMAEMLLFLVIGLALVFAFLVIVAGGGGREE